jgi:hypothetical protein
MPIIMSLGIHGQRSLYLHHLVFWIRVKDSRSILSWMELFLCSIALLFCGFFLFLVALPTKGKDICV